MISLRSMRLSQPQGYAEINRELLGVDASVWVATRPAQLDLRGRLLSATSSIGRVVTTAPYGTATKYTATASAGEQFGLQQIFTSNEAWTVLAVAQITAASVRKTIVSQRYGSGGSEQIDLFANADTALSISSGALTFFIRNTGAANQGLTASNQFDGAAHSWVARSSVAGGNALWRDGIPQTLSSNLTPAAATYVSATQQVAIGNVGDYTGSDLVGLDPIFLVVAWPRAIPDGMARGLSANPWLAFAPARRRIVTAVTGAPYPTLTAAGMTGITSTGGRPQVSYSF